MRNSTILIIKKVKKQIFFDKNREKLRTQNEKKTNLELFYP